MKYTLIVEDEEGDIVARTETFTLESMEEQMGKIQRRVEILEAQEKLLESLEVE